MTLETSIELLNSIPRCTGRQRMEVMGFHVDVLVRRHVKGGCL